LAWGYFKATGRALKGDILKFSHEGETIKRAASTIRKRRRGIFKKAEALKLRRREARRAKKEMKIMTPFSPLGKKIKTAKREPNPAPIKSAK